jgi:hypothetical protein
MAVDNWVGWLIDDLGDRRDEVVEQLKEAINKRNIPMYGNRDKTEKVEVKIGKANMWFRNDTPQLSVTSEMDGTVTAHIVVQDYGTSLWVAVTLRRGDRDNWAKSMGWSAFKVTLDRIIEETIIEIAGNNQITDVADPRPLDSKS